MSGTGGWRPELRRMGGDVPFQRRVWRTPRGAGVAMLSIVVAALAGAFGGGSPMAEGSRHQGGVEVQWSRIQRLGVVAPLRLSLPADKAVIRFDSELLDGWRLRNVTPEPMAVQAGPDGYRFAAAGAVVVLETEAIGWPGPRRLRLRAGGEDFDLPVLVWP